MKEGLGAKQTKGRRGVVLICVLVCLGVVLSLAASSIRSIQQSRRQAKSAKQLVQADLLLDAGVKLARKRLQSGELTTDLEVTVSNFGGSDQTAIVRIQRGENTESGENEDSREDNQSDGPLKEEARGSGWIVSVSLQTAIEPYEINRSCNLDEI